jgi:cation:H+ antiporter
MGINLIIYIAAFVAIWVGSGMAISAVERVSKTLKLSSFAVSFLILGFFTSVSELSVGVNAVLENDPEIFIGNLIGASLVIFMMIVPLLAITSNGLKINREFQNFNLLISMIVIGAPVILSMDGKIDRIDALISIVLYLFLLVCIQAKRGILETKIDKAKTTKAARELVKIIIGVAIIFVGSKFVVDQTLYFSGLLHISPFLISLLFIAIGTNIPELSFVFRSMFMKNNQVAFGDYVGSASFNTFLFGALTLYYGKTIYLNNSYMISLVFLLSGLCIFYYLAKTKHTISRIEGLLLLLIYVAFLLVEILFH